MYSDGDPFNAGEALDLLQQAGLNRDHLSFITAKLREQIDECGEPASLVPTFGDSEVDHRRRRLTAKLNHLRAEAWRLPLPIGSDEPLSRMRPQLERWYRELAAKVKAGSVSKASLLAMANKAAREVVEQKAARAH